MLLRRPDVLFVPAHTVPLIHPRNTVVVIHGLEYEICPESYSFWSRLSMRASIYFSCHVAQTVICVSENTKRDVIRLYGTPADKIAVIYEGYEKSASGVSLRGSEATAAIPIDKTVLEISGLPRMRSNGIQKPYILFIGRLEERKNIVRYIQSFKIAKEKYNIPHKLVLAGKPGYGYEKIQKAIENYQTINNKQQKKCHPEFISGSRTHTGDFVKDGILKQVQYDSASDIVELGYVNEEEKWELLRNADMFLFATLYEGFGIPVLEAQSVGVPVITSNTSSLPEVAGEGALLVNPESIEEIAEAMQSLISNQTLKSAILYKGAENVKRFSWKKCAKEIGVLLKK
jgi:glycosyltransferase involved in cell wall biosynthesis